MSSAIPLVRLTCGVGGGRIPARRRRSRSTEAAKQHFKEKGIRIELVDGEQFAKLIMDHGVVPPNLERHNLILSTCPGSTAL
jgi:hypothetical protein